MKLDQWLQTYLPKGKNTLSIDAVEILIKLAWEEASKSQRYAMSGWTPPKEILGPYDIP